MRDGKSANGFTLIELLVVMAVIAILASMAVPAAFYVRQTSRVAKAKSDLSTIATALTNFRSDWRVFPPHRLVDVAAGHFGRRIVNSICQEAPAGTVVQISERREGDDESSVITRDYDTNRILIRFLSTVDTGPYLTVKGNDKVQDGKFIDSGGQGLEICDCREGAGASTVPAEMMIDPWGKPYVYYNNIDRWDTTTPDDHCVHNVKEFDLYSTGPDGITATTDPDNPSSDPCQAGQATDDINNWGSK